MRVTWSRRAVSDLRKITEYIGADNPGSAARVASRIFEEVMTLSTMSHRGRIGTMDGTLELIFHPWPYIAVYRIAGEQVRIICIRHAAQYWPR